MSDIEYLLTVHDDGDGHPNHSPVTIVDDGSWQARGAATLRLICRIAVFIAIGLISPVCAVVAVVAFAAALGAGYLEHGNPLNFLRR